MASAQQHAARGLLTRPPAAADGRADTLKYAGAEMGNLPVTGACALSERAHAAARLQRARLALRGACGAAVRM
jgi:hypothetical protein